MNHPLYNAMLEQGIPASEALLLTTAIDTIYFMSHSEDYTKLSKALQVHADNIVQHEDSQEDTEY